MKWNKANFAGLTSPGQQSEMKAILAGTWPPLKPLPVFKYETPEYRATIDFDRKRGEWVCRKTSLPSNEVQELRGGLREITLALPHGEAETPTESAEPQEQELEKDAHRRFQAIREWKEKYENGARYFELRDFLSESQRTELDDSLRLSLTARQLQFNPKNVSSVFDDLSVAGGRFAALIEFAKQNKTSQGIDAHAPMEGAVAEAEGAVPKTQPAPDNDEQFLEINSPECGDALNNNDPVVVHQEAAERCMDAHEFPALSIKNVFQEPEQPPIAERMAHKASQQFEIETSDFVDEDFPAPAETFPAEPSHAEPSHEEGHQSRAFTGFAAQAPTGQSSADPIEGSPSRLPHLEVSAFAVKVFALLFLFAMAAFTVGLIVGHGPVGRRPRPALESLLATETKPTTVSDHAGESASRTLPPPVANSGDSADINRPADASPSEEKSKENAPGPDLAGIGPIVRPKDSDASPITESKPSAKPEIPAERSGAIAPGPVVPSVPPPVSSKLVRPSSRFVRRPKAVHSIRSVPRSPAPYRLTSAMSAAAHLARPSTILVTFPGQESQPVRVRFPEKAVAATSSFAMTSQLSVLVSPEPGPAVARQSARLESGELVSFHWPRYPRPGDRHGLAETIRVRATIGQLGEVQEVKLLSGSASLRPATMEAIRQWRYTPTLLDNRPVQAQQDLTIEFRPPQSSRLSTRHASHN